MFCTTSPVEDSVFSTLRFVVNGLWNVTCISEERDIHYTCTFFTSSFPELDSYLGDIHSVIVGQLHFHHFKLNTYSIMIYMPNDQMKLVLICRCPTILYFRPRDSNNAQLTESCSRPCASSDGCNEICGWVGLVRAFTFNFKSCYRYLAKLFLFSESKMLLIDMVESFGKQKYGLWKQG